MRMALNVDEQQETVSLSLWMDKVDTFCKLFGTHNFKNPDVVFVY
jgi:hypothetical protein